MKRFVIIAAVGIAGCKGHQQVASSTGTTTDTGTQKPAWVNSRPVSDVYYIGIGLCPKNRSDFQETAKKNALNDLASEISVKVEGSSLLYTLDQKTSFSESYTGTINTSTSEQLEGYELVDSWDGGTDQWIYYRLSKAEHARIKAERKSKAIGTATDLYMRAQQSLVAGDLKTAIDQDLRALLAMKEYWGENDKALIGEKEVPVVNEIYGHVQSTVNGVLLTSLPDRCKLEQSGHFRRELMISARTSDGKRSRDLPQLPLVITYPGMSGKVSELKSTDTDGHVRVSVQRVELQAASRELIATIDMGALVSKELEPAFIGPLVASLNVPKLTVPIDVDMPRVFMQALETNLGQAIGDAGASVAIKEELTSRGFRFVDSPMEADLLMKVNGATRQGGEANGFFTAYLDLSVSFKDRRTGETVYEGGKQGVKGIQLNYAKAGIEAYKKASQDLRGEIVTAMLNALL